MVTGPSLTSSTLHVGLVGAGFDAPRRPRAARRPRRRRARARLGRRRAIERRPPALPGVAVQRELRHRQHRAPDVGQGAVHLARARRRRRAGRGSCRRCTRHPPARRRRATPTSASRPGADLADRRPSPTWTRARLTRWMTALTACPRARRQASTTRSPRCSASGYRRESSRWPGVTFDRARSIDAFTPRVLALEIEDEALDALALQPQVAARRAAAADDRQAGTPWRRRAPRLR